jgi:Transposase and inactivated derivatives
MEYIGGENRKQIIMLPDSVDDYVDESNAVRIIDAYIDSLDMGALGFSHPKANDTGRPMYNPKDLLKLYVYGYMNRVRSSRRLEIETKRNLEVIWLMRKLSPDHKTIAQFRRNNADALKNVFRDFTKLCIKLGLYGKELIAIDGSKFKAANSKDRNFTEQKLSERIAKIDAKIEEYLRNIEDTDTVESAVAKEKSAQEIKQIITELEQRKAVYKSYSNEMKEIGETQKSLTDSDSRLMMANGKTDICYNMQISVDAKNKLIVDFEATNKANDKNQLMPMAVRAGEILEAKGLTAVADVGYDSATDIAECIKNGITPQVAGVDYDICLETDAPSANEISSHTNGHGVYLRERNLVLCPMGKILYPGGYKKRNSRALFYNYKACLGCLCKCTVERFKKFEISIRKEDFRKTYNDDNLHVKQVRVTSDKEIIRQRKCIVEHPFGTIKRSMDSGYCLMKGLGNVTGEFSLTFFAYNLKRAISILGVEKLLEAVMV